MSKVNCDKRLKKKLIHSQRRYETKHIKEERIALAEQKDNYKRVYHYRKGYRLPCISICKYRICYTPKKQKWDTTVIQKKVLRKYWDEEDLCFYEEWVYIPIFRKVLITTPESRKRRRVEREWVTIHNHTKRMKNDYKYYKKLKNRQHRHSDKNILFQNGDYRKHCKYRDYWW